MDLPKGITAKAEKGKGMRHSETAKFSTDKIKRICAERGVDFATFADLCEKLDGRTGRYNRWLDLVHGKSCYDFKLDDGSVEVVPAQLVVED